MRYLVNSFFVLAVCWLVAAYTDLWPNDEVRVFSKTRVVLKPGEDKPEWLPVNVSSYKISGEKIVSEVNGSVSTYEDCDVFSLKNWQCSFSDGSGTFGMRDGDFREVWSKPNPRSVDFASISQFEYHILSCRWDALDGAVQLILGCGLRPFLE